jgi:hypothetical protein
MNLLKLSREELMMLPAGQCAVMAAQLWEKLTRENNQRELSRLAAARVWTYDDFLKHGIITEK